MRSSGVLLPVPMLNGPYGIGVFGKQAKDFILFLANSGFGSWQILPIEHTGAANSPYKCVSAFAGEPMLIDPGELLEIGLITRDELNERMADVNANFVDYEIVFKKQWRLLKIAFSRLRDDRYREFKPFWLEEYALYMALKNHFDDLPWYEWPDADIRSYKKDAIAAAGARFKEEVNFHCFVQWLFDKQWNEILNFANKHGVTIIGDMPFYVSEDSADVWSRRELFDIGDDGSFAAVAGVPPDYFNPDGQRWGNPVYHWERLKKSGYEWWIDRMREAGRRYNLVRIDHFRGFESFWRIPADSETAREGKWVKGPGIEPFEAMEKALGKLPVIAEDLGDIGEEVRILLKQTGYMGMRVLQFGFLGDGTHLPHSYPENCVAYTGTHDNTTLLAWIFEMNEDERRWAMFYLGYEGDWSAGGKNCTINRAWIRALFMSRASLVIVPIQDLLGYGGDTRTNIPGTAEGNWRFRVTENSLAEIDTGFYRELNRIFGRAII